MPEPNAKEVPMAGGKVSSSECPSLHLIATEALLRLARRCEMGVERKGTGAWNAMTQHNQDCVTDREFILSRIDHGIRHLFLLRDNIARGRDPMAADDDAAAVMWTGMFLCCATAALAQPTKNCSACGGSGAVACGPKAQGATPCAACLGVGVSRQHDISDLQCPPCKGSGWMAPCPACRGTGKSKI